MTKSSTVYLGDPYFATTTAQVSSGATTLPLSDVSEFLPTGKALVSGLTISYTGISGLNLTGVTGITKSLAAQTQVVPDKNWLVRSQLLLYPAGGDAPTLSVSLGQGSVGRWNQVPPRSAHINFARAGGSQSQASVGRGPELWGPRSAGVDCAALLSGRRLEVSSGSPGRQVFSCSVLPGSAECE